MHRAPGAAALFHLQLNTVVNKPVCGFSIPATKSGPRLFTNNSICYHYHTIPSLVVCHVLQICSLLCDPPLHCLPSLHSLQLPLSFDPPSFCLTSTGPPVSGRRSSVSFPGQRYPFGDFEVAPTTSHIPAAHFHSLPSDFLTIDNAVIPFQRLSFGSVRSPFAWTTSHIRN